MGSRRVTLRFQLFAIFLVYIVVLVVLAAAARITGAWGLVAAVLAFTVLGAAAIYWWFDKRVFRPLGGAVAFLESIAAGDLSVEPRPRTEDEIGRLYRAIDAMAVGIRELLVGIKQAGLDINKGTSEILASIVQQSAGASEQASSISETSTTVTEVKQTSEQAAGRAQDIVGVSEQSAEFCTDGETSVEKTVEEFDLIADQVEKSAVSVLTLSEKTQQISEILRTVRELAERSNILSLNASIEAARAGEAGKGFGVVAVEVKNLADQSKAAASQIQEILNEIQSAANTSVMVAEEASKRVDRGKEIVGILRERMENLSEAVATVGRSAKQIASSSNQQSIGMEQVALAMENINQVAAENVTSIKEIEDAARGLSDLGARLAGLTGRYRLEV
ncbi:MAG TPA: methyl-accepting chemotaxis protein [bacterium]|nr:methyl-accepting chemotaxis protein [bacterium]